MCVQGDGAGVFPVGSMGPVGTQQQPLPTGSQPRSCNIPSHRGKAVQPQEGCESRLLIPTGHLPQEPPGFY